MRWIPWALGLVGVLQYALMVMLDPSADYVSTDMSYLVMWLAIIGALIICNTGCGCWGGDGGCGCCGEGCSCGDCGNCMPHKGGHDHGHEHGHEGHQH